MPGSVTPEFHVKAAPDATCPICGLSSHITHIKTLNQIVRTGKSCPHLKPFECYRKRTTVKNSAGVVIDLIEGPLYAVFAPLTPAA